MTADQLKPSQVHCGLPQTLETRHAIGQVIRSSSSTAANYRSACRAKSKADFISKLGTVEEEADESGFWLEMLRDILELRSVKSDVRTLGIGPKQEVRQSPIDIRTLEELDRLEDEADQLVAITVASKKTARGNHD